MALEKILIPYNFSRFDEKALAFAARALYRLPMAEMTLFNVYTPLPEFETAEQTVMGKLKGSLSYLHQKISDQENALKAVVQRLYEEGLSRERLRYLYRPRKKDIAGEILDLILQEGYTYVVLSRRTGRVTRFFTGSVSARVLTAAKNVTVCVIT